MCACPAVFSNTVHLCRLNYELRLLVHWGLHQPPVVFLIFVCLLFLCCIRKLHTKSWVISVGIATRYGTGGPGIESRWGGGEIFRAVQSGTEAHPACCRWVPMERGFDHPSTSSAGWRMDWNCTSASPVCLNRLVLGVTFTFSH